MCLQGCCYHWRILLQRKHTLVFLPHPDSVHILVQTCQVDGSKGVWEGVAKIKCTGFTDILKTFRLIKTHPFNWWRRCCLCLKDRQASYKYLCWTLLFFLSGTNNFLFVIIFLFFLTVWILNFIHYSDHDQGGFCEVAERILSSTF